MADFVYEIACTGDRITGPLRAAFSYVVRYHHPVEDETKFVTEHIASHPPLLGKLPHVRSILCYLPLRTAGILPATDYVIGNEVAFDSVDHFNVAMASPVRHELRAHYQRLPAHGRTTHFPMLRRRLEVPANVPSVAG